MDQGITLLKIFELWQEKKFTLIGPESSIKTLQARAFFHGPWIYYFLLPVMLISNWNPLAGSYLFIGLNFFGLVLLFNTVKAKFGPRVAFLACFLFSLSPQMIYFSQFFWNPNFLPLVSILIIFLWFKIAKNPCFKNFLFLGLVLGFGLGCHYQIVILTFIILMIMILKKISWKHFFALFLGLLIALSPLEVFELKHNFYNLRTIFLILREGTQGSFKISFYHLLFLLPFLYLALALLLERVFLKKPAFALGLIGLFTFHALIQIIPTSKSGFSMPEAWTYTGLLKTKQIILRENKPNFNIASLLSGDTRDYPLRFLLTAARKPALDVETYPQAEYLFVLSPHAKDKTISNSVWEINSFCPCKLQKTWEIQNNIRLYLLEKN